MLSLQPLMSGQFSITSNQKLPGAPVCAFVVTSGSILNIFSKTPGVIGNSWKLWLRNPGGTNTLSHQLDLNTRQLTINLGTSAGSVTTTGQQLLDYVNTTASELHAHFSFSGLTLLGNALTAQSAPVSFASGADAFGVMSLKPTHAIFSISGNNVRYRVDASPATASVGQRALSNTNLEFMNVIVSYDDLLTRLSFIPETGTAVIDYTLYRLS